MRNFIKRTTAILIVLTQMTILLSKASFAVSDTSVPTESTTSVSNVFLAKDSEWKYLDNGVDLGTAFRAVDFDDSSWKAGKAPLGFGDDYSETDPTLPLATTINYGDPNNKYMTTYFRKQFEVKGLNIYNSLDVYIHVDDGAVVYINGTEAFRKGIEEGINVTYNTGAKFSKKEEIFKLPVRVLKEGINTIAAEVHQDDGQSSDLWFEMYIKGSSIGTPTETIATATPVSTAIQTAIPTPTINDNNDKIPSQIALAMTTDPQTSISINWTTVDTSLNDAKISVWEKTYSEDAAGIYPAKTEKRTVSSSTLKNINNQPVTTKNFYSAILTGLKPNTEYLYRCGASGIMSEIKSFKTANAIEEAYTYIYISDSQVSGNNSKGWNANLDIIKKMYPNAKFIYIAGDLTDTAANEGQWESFFNQPGNTQYNQTFSGSLISEIPVAAIMGNHDASSGGVGGMGSHYTWASQVNGVPVSYAFTYGAARFIMLNIENSYSMSKSALRVAQTEFLRNEVAKAKKDCLWTIVGFHKSIYSGGNHMDDADVIDNRKYWGPIFAQLSVDAVLQGHDHILSRGFVKADGTKAKVTTKVEDRVYNAKQPDNAPLYYVGNCGSTLKFYAMLTNNNWIKPGDPVAPNYEFLDLNSAAPVGSLLNPLGPITDDDLEGVDPNYMRLPTFTAITVSKGSMKYETYMTGFDRNTNKIIKDTFLYDSFTVTKDVKVSASSAKTNPSKNVTIKVKMNQIENVGGLKIKLAYDATNLTVDNVQMAPEFASAAVNTNTAGEIIFNGINSDGITNSSMDIAAITFKVNSNLDVSMLPMNVTIKVASAEASNLELQEIVPIYTEDGTITIAPTVLPVASDVKFTGECVSGQTLTASYAYSDGDNRPEAGTKFRWLIADVVTGTYSPIEGAESKTLKVTKEMTGKAIKLEVTPANLEDTGVPVSGDNGRNVVIKTGDVNKDNKVNYIDGLKTLQYITGKVKLDPQSVVAADVSDMDGVNVNDVTTMLKADVGLIAIE